VGEISWTKHLIIIDGKYARREKPTIRLLTKTVFDVKDFQLLWRAFFFIVFACFMSVVKIAVNLARIFFALFSLGVRFFLEYFQFIQR